ncbi:MAG: hypothetical protein M0024_01370 [Nitrospiraceae bacterium]|nr:hypothetical protein [Nitrospiraceae bacterium]
MWIPIFKAGTHTDSAGDTQTWTEQDLDRIAAYDPAKHEAPVVIGHPKSNAPAYAWVEAVKREGSMLYMKMKDIAPEFSDMLKRKLFKKRSISLYPDGSLRHVGFLGAMPPAVKGLPDVAFADDGGATIEFMDNEDVIVRGVFQRLRDFLLSKWGPDAANSVVTQGDLDELLQSAMEDEQEDSGMMPTMSEAEKFKRGLKTGKEEYKMSFWERLKKRLAEKGISFSELFGSETPPVLFTEGDVQTKIDSAVATAVKEKEAEFSEGAKRKLAELQTREEALRQKEAATRKAGITAFCEDLKKKGILTPAMDKLGMGVTSFMEQIASIETPIEFGEGDGKGKQTPLEFMQAFLGGLPKAIEFGEVAGAGKEAVPAGSTAGEKLDALAKKKMAENKDLTYSRAFSEVQSENKELAAAYADELAG